MLDDDKAESTPGSKTMPKSAETRPAATRVNHGLETNSVGDLSFRSHEHQFVIASALRNLDLRPSRIDMISRIIAGLTGRVKSPWLVVVVHFSDDPIRAPSHFPQIDRLAPYKRVFTK